MIVRRELSGTETFVYTQTWTADNRLQSVIKTDITGTVLAQTSYFFDGDGTRMRKDDPDGTVLYVGATEAVIGAPGTVAIEYYDDTQAGTFSFLNYTKTVVSATTGISYAWAGVPPLAGMGGAPWALRWNQWVSVTQAGLYTITVIADDGVGLSIAGVSVIYSLSIRDTGPLTAGVGVSMAPGNLYQLQVSYLNYTSTNGASVRLMWTRPDGVIEDIPASALRARGRRDYYSFGGAVVAMKEGVTSAPRVLSYLHGDHLGSTSLTTNISGTVVSQQRYKPYGEVRWSSGVGLPTDFTFTGQRAGPANYVGSLMDYNARFFSPALGRFVSADTIVPGAGNSAAFNRYTYVLGNPLRLTDPTGHCPKGDSECQKRDKQLETTLGYRPDGVDVWETGDFDTILNLLSKGFTFDGVRWSAHTLNSVAFGIEAIVAKYGEKRAYGAMEFGRRGKISLVNKPAGHASGQGGWAYPDERKTDLWLTDDDNVQNAWAVFMSWVTSWTGMQAADSIRRTARSGHRKRAASGSDYLGSFGSKAQRGRAAQRARMPFRARAKTLPNRLAGLFLEAMPCTRRILSIQTRAIST
jgi:RHS repeat-associated protein